MTYKVYAICLVSLIVEFYKKTINADFSRTLVYSFKQFFS